MSDNMWVTGESDVFRRTITAKYKIYLDKQM